ncbi:MAG: hypothetical protein LBN23_02280 [Paludibacter sp.]|jgi:hypothetical protein|nr:hypothetical protein [Paludibacter sp.]
MKQLFIFCLSALFFAGIGNAQTVITGQILKPANNNKLVYSTTGYTGFKDTLQTDDKGFFELKLTVAKSAFVSLRTTEPYKLVKLLVEPNGKYHVIFDEKKVVQITGTNEKGQALYARFPNPEFIQEEISAYKKDTTIAQIRRKIAQSKQSDIENLQKLYNKKEISPAFFKLAKVDRDCYYASLETFILLSIKSMRFNNLLKDD